MASTAPRYGTPNFAMLKTWLELRPEEDGPFWALNLMKYRAVADYQHAGGEPISGRAADDAYAPLGPLAAIGAMVAFHADVERQSGSSPNWDRVAIVRYPTRAAFFAMQERDDFKRQHEHKDAGMEFTIVMSCLPDPSRPPAPTPPDTTLVLRVARAGANADLPEVDGAIRLATFAVEGVIIGDDRTWSRAAFDAAPTAAIADALNDATAGIEEVFVLALADRRIDAIEESILRNETD